MNIAKFRALTAVSALALSSCLGLENDEVDTISETAEQLEGDNSKQNDLDKQAKSVQAGQLKSSASNAGVEASTLWIRYDADGDDGQAETPVFNPIDFNFSATD